MQVRLEGVRPLQFDDGTPVTSASALAPLGGGWLVAQDDATSGAWVRGDRVERLRLLPRVEGLDVFDEPGTAHLAPGLEAACGLVLASGASGVLLLGSGATDRQRRAVLVADGPEPSVASAPLDALYDAVARALAVPEGRLDLQGVARNGGVLRWFQRGDLTAGVPSGSVDVDLGALVDAVLHGADPAGVRVREPRTYRLGTLADAELAATDAVALPGGRVLLSAVAGPPPVAAALVLLDGEAVLDLAPLPEVAGAVPRVEGLGVVELLDDGARLLAVVDADDPAEPSAELALRLTW